MHRQARPKAFFSRYYQAPCAVACTSTKFEHEKPWRMYVFRYVSLFFKRRNNLGMALQCGSMHPWMDLLLQSQGKRVSHECISKRAPARFGMHGIHSPHSEFQIQFQKQDLQCNFAVNLHYVLRVPAPWTSAALQNITRLRVFNKKLSRM